MVQRRVHRTMAMFATCIVCLSGMALSQAGEKMPEGIGPAFDMTKLDMNEAFAKWTATTTPGTHHEMLMRFAGEYELSIKMWGMPGQPPMESTGKATATAICGGRFLREEMTGTMMGHPITGMSLIGYDNFTKSYVMSSVSSHSTAMLNASGRLSEDGKTLTMYGNMDEPMFDWYGRTVKYVQRYIDENTHVFEVWDLAHNEGGAKVVEFAYRRIK